jgi:hypothetical protein
MANIPSPPGFDPKWSLASAYMSPQRAEPSQDWLTPAGALRQDLDAHHNVAQFEAGAMKFAQGQTGTLFQTLFFMWMIGTQLSLFSMIFLVQGGFTPFLSILRVNLGACVAGAAPGGAARSPLRRAFRSSARLLTLSPTPLPFAARAAFAPFSLPGVNTTMAKALYIAIHAVGCFFIAWKLKALGILPITSADWVQLIPARRFTDFSS